jgi:hypothetical protein
MKTAIAIALCLLVVLPEVSGQVPEARSQVPETRGQVPEATGRVRGFREASPKRDAPRGASRSLGKKILFTTIGAAGGFAAGLYFGLKYFDDALYSDRKVWTCIAIGTAAGGVAGALLAPDATTMPTWKRSPPDAILPADAAALTSIRLGTRSLEHRALVDRVRRVSGGA